MLDVLNQIKRRGFVGANRQAAGIIVAQLTQRVFKVRLQILKPAGILQDHPSRICKQEFTPGTVDQLFLEIAFQSLNRN